MRTILSRAKTPMNKHKIVLVAGARPNFMKLAPLLRLLHADAEFTPVFVHTGQHYDDRLSGCFFRDLALPNPDHHLGVGSGSHAQQTAEIMKRFEPVVLDEKPDSVLVVGDVNSTMAAAIVSSKLEVPVIHVEAGLRSCDRSMPEEINRVITDAISDLLLVTEESGRHNLLKEGIADARIHLVGNLMIDSLRQSLSAAQTSDILERLSIGGDAFGLVTLHRPSNVDSSAHLDEVVAALSDISRSLPLLFPVHPRTRGQLSSMHVQIPDSIRLIDPLGYLDFLCLMSNSSLVLTDSGGIQEETTALGIPCITLRENTERPVTIQQGTNILGGTRRETILAAWRETVERPKSGTIPPFWDGSAASRCVAAIRAHFTDASTQSPSFSVAAYA